MKAAKGLGLATEPGMVKGTSNGAALSVRKGEEFHKVHCRINHGKCKDGDGFARGAVGAGRMFGWFDGRLGDNPGADQINVDFFPGIDVTMHLNREVAIFFCVVSCSAGRLHKLGYGV